MKTDFTTLSVHLDYLARLIGMEGDYQKETGKSVSHSEFLKILMDNYQEKRSVVNTSLFLGFMLGLVGAVILISVYLLSKGSP